MAVESALLLRGAASSSPFAPANDCTDTLSITPPPHAGRPRLPAADSRPKDPSPCRRGALTAVPHAFWHASTTGLPWQGSDFGLALPRWLQCTKPGHTGPDGSRRRWRTGHWAHVQVPLPR